MVFSDRAFLFLFLPLVMLIILALSKSRWRDLAILICSLVFYYYSSGLLIWVLFLSIFISYAAAPYVRNIYFLAGAILSAFLPLIYFKYSGFVVNNLGVAKDSDLYSFFNVMLPAGISFFTFQAVSYLVDVHRAHIEPERNFIRYAAYLSFFPQLIAGPIVRFADVKSDFVENNSSAARFSKGVVRFSHGLMKKVLIADNAARIADACFAVPDNEVVFIVAALGMIAYSVQIYFDFSGYSDMAIGLGLMFGIRFPENFNVPYAAKSITDFWRRWHISLSSWFRDYLYIPLGGNRGSGFATTRNLMIVFLATGIWHGAAWTFIVWGLYHGFFILIERLLAKRYSLLFQGILWRYFYLLPIAMIGWVIFRAETFSQAGAHITALFMPFASGAFNIPSGVYAASTPSAQLMLGVGCLAFFKSGERSFGTWLEAQLDKPSVGWIVVAYVPLVLFVSAIASLSAGFSPFIYFQF